MWRNASQAQTSSASITKLRRRTPLPATATIGVAHTELFPRLSLSGLLGLNAATIGNLVKSESAAYTLGVGLSL